MMQDVINRIEKEYEYKIENDRIIILKYIGKNNSIITIPSGVNEIGENCFKHINDVKKVIIENGVTTIRKTAFYNCSNLTSIIIPNTVTKIEEYAFTDCVLLTSVIIGNRVESIGKYSFSNCYRLVEIVNKSSLNITKGSEDYGCIAKNAKQVIYDESESKLSTDSNGFITYNDGTDIWLVNYIGDDTEITIPSNVTKINDFAFYNCINLTSVTIPNSVTSIGNNAFSGCKSFKNLIIGNRVESIGKYSFSNCYRLVEIVNKSSLNITKGSEDYGRIAYYAKQVISDESESKLSTDLNGFITYNDGTDIWLVNYIGNDTEITIPSNVTKINDYAFYKCYSVTSITIPNSVTSIGNDAFSGCKSLKNVIISNSIDIGDYVFGACDNLISVTIGNSVTSIGGTAFYGCYKLVEVINKSSLNITKGSNDYGYIAYYAKQVISDESESKLSTDSNGFITYNDGTDIWLVNYIGNDNEITIPNNVTKINDYAFYKCYSVTNITIPNSVTSIGNNAFSRCENLKKVTLLEGVTSIGESAFRYCYNLTSVAIPNSVTSIESRAFSNCCNLTSVTVGNSVTSIGKYAFFQCYNLTNVTVSASVTSIGSDAFYECYKLVEVINKSSFSFELGSTFYGHIAEYAKQVIYDESESKLSTDSNGFITYNDGADIWLVNYMGNDTEITIPNNVTKINDYAFYNCSNLTNIIISNSVTSIGNNAFNNCKSLISIIIPNNIEKVGENAFTECDNLIYNKYDNAYYLGNLENPYLVLVKAINNSINDLNFDIRECDINDNAKIIYDGAFKCCINLAIVAMPKSITSIGNYAFSECRALKSITIPNSVISIGDYAFAYCRNLTNILIPESVTSIGKKAFDKSCKIKYYGTMDQWKNINISLWYEEEKIEIVSSNDKKFEFDDYYRKGNRIYFGTNNLYFNPEKKLISSIFGPQDLSIEWDILDIKDGKALIITHNIIDIKPFGNINNYRNSTIRKWLNDDFYDSVFNDKDKDRIETTIVDNSFKSVENFTINKFVCTNTKDKLFLLSYSELNKYYSSSKDMVATGVSDIPSFMKEKSYTSKQLCCWWLRSPSFENKNRVYIVDYDGYLNVANSISDFIGVRPVCWFILDNNDPLSNYKVEQGKLDDNQYDIKNDCEIVKKQINRSEKVYFGEYFINDSQKKSPIEWDILEEQDGKALIISSKILVLKNFDDVGLFGEGEYESSSIRNWLCNDFFNFAFSNEEKSAIILSEIDNSANFIEYEYGTSIEERKNKYNYTKDKVFLLSIREAIKYRSKIYRRIKLTEYAKYHNPYLYIEKGTWWLRSTNNKKAYFVNDEGCILRPNIFGNQIGVRPACWVYINSLFKNKG